jgi:hypothetical protein
MGNFTNVVMLQVLQLSHYMAPVTFCLKSNINLHEASRTAYNAQ